VPPPPPNHHTCSPVCLMGSSLSVWQTSSLTFRKPQQVCSKNACCIGHRCCSGSTSRLSCMFHGCSGRGDGSDPQGHPEPQDRADQDEPAVQQVPQRVHLLHRVHSAQRVGHHQPSLLPTQPRGPGRWGTPPALADRCHLRARHSSVLRAGRSALP